MSDNYRVRHVSMPHPQVTAELCTVVMPANTTYILQPKDQGVSFDFQVLSFKKYIS